MNEAECDSTRDEADLDVKLVTRPVAESVPNDVRGRLVRRQHQTIGLPGLDGVLDEASSHEAPQLGEDIKRGREPRRAGRQLRRLGCDGGDLPQGRARFGE